MALAWDIDCVTPHTIPRFFQAYSEREFGAEHAMEISSLLLSYDRLMALRRHEHMETHTLSLLHYREADSIMERYANLTSRAAAIFAGIQSFNKAAFFQLVLHPIKASNIFLDLHISLARNKIYGQQRRNTTNHLAQRVLELFDLDWSLAEEYHNSPWSGNKWNHIMKQPHYGFPTYETYHTPSRDMITGLSFVQRRQNPSPIAGQMGVAVEGHIGVLPGLVNEECCRMQPSRFGRAVGLTLAPLSPFGPTNRYFEVYTQGTRDVAWTVNAAVEWIHFSRSAGTLSPDNTGDHRVELTVDWSQVPRDFNSVVHIDICSAEGNFEQIHLPVVNQRPPEDFCGFVESDGVVSIEIGAVHLIGKQQSFYKNLPYIGRTISGSVALVELHELDVPYLEYPLFLFSTPASVTIILYFTMALDAHPENSLSYNIQFDETAHDGIRLLKTKLGEDLPEGWSTAVQDGVWIRRHSFPMKDVGSHMVRYRPLASGLMLEKLVVDIGGLQESYLGPPPSSYVGQSVSKL
jgi:Gylcosyl hydrolase family 115 C-terminal domain/Glycosyl hydrolase family 115